MSIQVRLTETGNVEQLLERLPVEIRGNTMRKALRAAGRVVQKQAKANVPRSRTTRTRDKWSSKTKQQRAGVAEHHKTVGVEVRVYDGVLVAIVGARYPEGALAHLIEQGHDLVAWGTPLPIFVQGNPYLAPAADTTRREQEDAIIRKLSEEVDKAGR